MSDLSLKYELMRNNESRVIGFFARQLMVLQRQNSNGQNGGFHSEYSKLDRFLSVLNFNKKSIEYIAQRITFDGLLNSKVTVREQILYDAGTIETERTDFRNALNALKDCIDYFSHGGTNDNGRFYWHKEMPTTPTIRQHRLSDTALPTPQNTEPVRSTSVSSSISTEFTNPNNTQHHNHNQMPISSSPHTRRNNVSHTPPPSRLNHLSVNGKGRCEHPNLQLPTDDSSSRRSSYGSDSEGRLASGSATPKSPTVRSPTMSGSPFGSAQNSDAENDTRVPDAHIYNAPLSFLGHRIAHKIQHKWSNLIKLSTCNVCSKKIFFLGTKCNLCKYKCHKECIPNAPPNCGFSEVKLRRVIDNTDIQIALANSSPLSRKYPFSAWDNSSPTQSASASVPGSPALHTQMPGYHFNPSISVRESIYSTQNDPDSWVVIETTPKSTPEIPESQSDSDTNSTIQTETGTNLIDSTATTTSSKLVRQPSQSEPLLHPRREDLVKSKLFDINSFDDDEADPEKRSANLATSIQDWVIVYNNIKIIEELPRSSGTLMKAHWHGEIAVRMIQPSVKTNQVEFLNQFKNQVFRLRKVRHEHLNLYTGVCIESPHLAIVSNWIRGPNLFEMIHIRNDSIPLSLAAQYAAQIAQAMSYLHEKSINHMSLRTTNIFVQNTRIILTDYGLVPLSKCYRINNQPTIIAPRGWLSYLAPEIIRKLDPRDEQSFSQYTPQTDVYAFGTVWYELLFREFPYAKQPPEYIIWRAGNSLKQPLSSVHISKYAKDIINQCWSFVPDDRPDFAMLCKSLSKMPGKRALVRSPSTPLQYHTRPHIEAQF
ncbi:hypothetical protein I4U23_025905 [Adineta vaga]|nr:hypothetical protein I4U23_025905 [Adineta vaga]